jgi:hypothetical protein
VAEDLRLADTGLGARPAVLAGEPEPRGAALESQFAQDQQEVSRISRPAVEQLWRACAARGDLYQRTYRGRYCAGCEAFFEEEVAIIRGGTCRDRTIHIVLVFDDERALFRLGRDLSCTRFPHEPEIERIVDSEGHVLYPDDAGD